MRFDLAAFRQVLPRKASFNLSTVFAAGGISLAMLTVAYVTLFGAHKSAAEAEARPKLVAVTGPVFTPVAVTPAVAARYADPRDAEPSLPPEFDENALTRAVQTGLKRAGCYRGPVNGRWTPSTRAAMGAFTDRVNARLPVDRPDSVLLALIETHDEVSCTPAEHAAEAASPDEARPAVTREALLSSSTTAETHARAEHLSYADEDRHTVDTLASVETTSAGPEETAGGAPAAVSPAAVVPARKFAKKPERRRSTRKYRRKPPSVSRSVSRSLRSIRRSFNALW